MTDLFVRFDEVAASAARITQLAQESGTTVKELLTAFEGFNAPWGGDEPGQAFFDAYQEAARDALANATQVPRQVQAISAALSATVKAYRATEQNNADAAKRSPAGEESVQA